ncbi:hypothetical protein GCM10007866_06440 [Gluconobacter albidus]|uniref:Transposase n=1 Tax=Gluconobacter albidus TaxID=318683 RepID=A0ABQ5WXG4_9PROT|nr:hypothetical protein GCM10007866_06440 [Gluconobacter albidus]
MNRIDIASLLFSDVTTLSLPAKTGKSTSPTAPHRPASTTKKPRITAGFSVGQIRMASTATEREIIPTRSYRAAWT